MVIDIKMCRFENVPWGFRLVGGADFEYPLTVVKVTEGSIAEDAGLREGDVIVRINDTATSPLSHEEADKVIRQSGNVFYIGVQRVGQEELLPKIFPVLSAERPNTPLGFVDVNGSKSPIPPQLENSVEPQEYLPEQECLPERPSSVLSGTAEVNFVEDEIAAVLSGESEVLKEHNVMGIFPKPGVCMTSDVLRTLNEDATKTKIEKDKENKKWSTFLVKPDRPIPKSKEQIEAERRAANAYKVKIIKSMPRSRSPSPMPCAAQPAPPIEIKAPVVEEQPTPPKVEIDEEPPTDSEVPDLEEVKIVIEAPPEGSEMIQAVEGNIKNVEKVSNEEFEETCEVNEASLPVQDHDEPATIVNATQASVESAVRMQREKTEEELALERQLAEVQRQLAALSSLPSTIQTTLDAVTKQLAGLLPAFQLQAVPPLIVDMPVEPEVRAICLEKIDAGEEIRRTDENSNPESIPEGQHKVDTTESPIVEPEKISEAEVEVIDPVKKQEAQQNKEDMQQMEEELTLKKHKPQDVIEELEEQMVNKSNPRRSKRAFGPLTPSSERPLVLPGGRRWYRPKDAYNDEFIAETLSAQAELITGTTLGVNFMKYQKPERKIDLNRSEVYKVIHHLDRQPVRGIEIRPPVVPAEVDIRKVALQP